jgi:microcompartment protein CcmL/EutN
VREAYDALGMIETWGVAALIAAADAAAKAADVKVWPYEKIDAGIVTVYVVGDVAAVRAAVDAGASEASRVGKLLGSHVIPRPDPEGVPKFLRRRSAAASPSEESAPAAASEAAISATDPSVAATPPGSLAAAPSSGAGTDPEPAEPDEAVLDPERLAGMPVAALRKLARSIANFPLTGREISMAGKEKLVRLIGEAAARKGDQT